MAKHKNYNQDEIRYYYENTSLSISQISEKINISSDMIRYYIRKNNYIRSEKLQLEEKENIINRRRQTRYSKNNGNYFSDESIQQSKQTRYSKNNGNYFSDESNIKRMETNQNKYGVTNVFQSKLVQEKSRNTKLQKYGVSNYNNRNKALRTRLDRYGKYMTDEMLLKSKNTSMQLYGCEFASQSKDFKDKAKQTRYSKNNGNYFSQKTINRLKETSKDNYIKSNNKRIITLKNKYKSYNRCFYTSKKLLHILEDPEINFIRYINELDYENKNFAYIETDLNISYTALLNYAHKYKFKDLLNNTRSHFQQDVINFLKTLNIDYIENCRNIISPYEVDIYIPEKNIAIECNGNDWHSKYRCDKKYHYNKSVMCENLGVRLIHIFEYEWKNERQRPILENIIKNAIGINENKIYARKCRIVVKQSKEMRDFFDKNNIQGFRGGKFAICLEYNTEIIMAYMMGYPFFGKGKYEWEVIRGATKLGYTVVGGASKIFKYFIENYNPKNCVYYIDYNYFNGNSLKNLPNMKFIKTQISFKNYWINEGRVKNREPKRNSEIKELYRNGDVLQIYNAGTKVYIWEGDTYGETNNIYRADEKW